MGFAEVAKDPPKKTYTKKELAGQSAKIRKLRTSKYFCLNEAGETVWLTDYDGNSMVNFIERHQKSPFFLYWSPAAVHSPSTEAPESLMKRTTAKGERRKLAGAIVSVDDQIGKLIQTLEKQGLRKKTLIIFSSDNGGNGGEGASSAPYTGGKGKGTQKEGWVRVPTIFSMPGTLPVGTQYDDMIANFDFYSKIAALTSKSIPKHCDGVNLCPYLKGENTNEAHEYLFWLNNEPGDAERRHLIAARWKNWRLYKKYNKDTWQLFDLKKDPMEETNLAKKHPEIVVKMASKHTAWRQTLAPFAKIPKITTDQPIIPKGHGWAYPGDHSKRLGSELRQSQTIMKFPILLLILFGGANATAAAATSVPVTGSRAYPLSSPMVVQIASSMVATSSFQKKTPLSPTTGSPSSSRPT